MASAAYLPVHLVEDIFLHLDDAADLVRASAACTAFRRVVSDGRFLRRFRSFNHRPVLGLLRPSIASGGLRFHPAEPPCRSSKAARAVARASFLPADPNPTNGDGWHVHDARDGRVLLSPGDATMFCLPSSSDLAVYDPLHCKHVEIPPIPKDIVAWQGYYCRCGHCDCQFNLFLIPAAADEDDLSFRVMCTVLSQEMLEDDVVESFVYSSVTRKWRAVASFCSAEPMYRLSSKDRHYAHGCFYWVDSYEKAMLVLDMEKKKFSIVSLPPGAEGDLKIVVEAAEEDRIGLLVRHDQNQNTLHLYTKAMGGANDCWQRRHDVVVTLPDDSFEWLLGGAAEQGYALIQGVPRHELETLMYCSDPVMGPKANAHYFTVEVRTLVVEKLCVTEFNPVEPAFLYASFPPPFAPPSL